MEFPPWRQAVTIPWGVISCFALPMGAACSSVTHPQPSSPCSFTHQIPAAPLSASDSPWRAATEQLYHPGTTGDSPCFPSLSARLAMVM